MTTRTARFYYDFEFHERGVLDYPIDVISLGMVAPNGAEFYAQNYDADWPTIAQNPWLKANVLSHLTDFSLLGPGPLFDEKGKSDVWVPRKLMGRLVQGFVIENLEADQKVQLRGYYADYDHTILAGLFGRMLDMPDEILPIWTYDIKQRCWDLEQRIRKLPSYEDFSLRLPEQGKGEHNALADALYNREADRFLDLVESDLEKQTWKVRSAPVATVGSASTTSASVEATSSTPVGGDA